MVNELQTGKKVVGIKQLRKALKDGTVKTVFLAKNADPKLAEPTELLSQQAGVDVVWIETMQELGTACGIDVGASAAASLK